MAQVIITHPDGRRYGVSEQAFTDLYEPFGFTIEGVVYNGASLPPTEENLAKANEGAQAASGDTTAETAARAVILSDLEAEARARLATESPVASGDAGMIDPNATNTGTAATTGDASGATSDGSPEASPPARPASGKAAKSGEGS